MILRHWFKRTFCFHSNYTFEPTSRWRPQGWEFYWMRRGIATCNRCGRRATAHEFAKMNWATGKLTPTYKAANFP